MGLHTTYNCKKTLTLQRNMLLPSSEWWNLEDKFTLTTCTSSSSSVQRKGRKRHSPKTVQSCPHELTLLSMCSHTQGFSHFTAHPLELRKGPHVHYVTPVQCFIVLTVLEPLKRPFVINVLNFSNSHSSIIWNKISPLFPQFWLVTFLTTYLQNWPTDFPK